MDRAVLPPPRRYPPLAPGRAQGDALIGLRPQSVEYRYETRRRCGRSALELKRQRALRATWRPEEKGGDGGVPRPTRARPSRSNAVVSHIFFRKIPPPFPKNNFPSAVTLNIDVDLHHSMSLTARSAARW